MQTLNDEDPIELAAARLANSGPIPPENSGFFEGRKTIAAAKSRVLLLAPLTGRLECLSAPRHDSALRDPQRLERG